MSRAPSFPSPSRVPCALAACIALAAVAAAPAAAQSAGQAAAAAPEPTGWVGPSPFRPLDLPAPNTIRTGAGRPGPDYWQQRVEYELEASLDTATHRIRGSGTIRYHNRSPDALPFLWLKLDGSLCGDESLGSRLETPPLRFGESEFDFGCVGGSAMVLERLESGGRALAHDVYGTIVRVELPEPLEPGGVRELSVAWAWTHPEYGYGRTGRDGSLYQVAQWYPRAAVYDDLDGWNTEPFLGAGEFYQEFGSFDVALTLPAGFTVTATGVLTNPEEVLTPVQRERLARAATSEEVVAIVTPEEARAGATARVPGTKTWRFFADSVRDFAFAAAPNFVWEASDLDGVRIQTLWRPEAEPWREAHRMARSSIAHFSERLAPYPWPHATTVEGPNEGMEYPMLTFVPAPDSREELFFVLTHEFGHEWFPMLVNTNERRHAWMDEGFNTFADIASIQEYFAGEAYADTVTDQPLNLYPEHALPGRELPMARPPTEQTDLYWAAYFKPALMMHLLRTEVVGAERFDRAFAEYVRTWSFKHPAPADFFRFFEDATGMELDWFWRGWVYSAARLDQAVVEVEPGGPGTAPVVRLRAEGDLLMPVEMRVERADGSEETVRLPAEMWMLGPDFRWTGEPGAPLVAVEVDPRGVYPDVDRADNRWEAAGGRG